MPQMGYELLIPLCNILQWTHAEDMKWFGGNGSSHLSVSTCPILAHIWLLSFEFRRNFGKNFSETEDSVSLDRNFIPVDLKLPLFLHEHFLTKGLM